MAHVQGTWHKLYARPLWGKRGTMNRRMMLVMTRVPIWWVLYDGCVRWTRHWTWRDQKSWMPGDEAR